MKLQGEKETAIIQHCAAFGTLRTVVRKFDVGDPRPYAQHPVSVTIGFVEPGKRAPKYITMTPGGYRFATIERGGKVLYDSRNDVPIDMTKWAEAYRRNRAEWLARQKEIDEENANAPPGVHTKQMGDFRIEEPDAGETGAA